MNNKVIVLNSGGFDSICLMHYIKHTLKKEILSLFFDYGQKNAEQERECSQKCSIELGCQHLNISLPPMLWSKSSVTNKNNTDINNQYIEWRNLIFLSYAKSIAESQKIEDIYVAFLKQEEGHYYNDTSLGFLTWFNSNTDVIDVHAPFLNKYKEDLLPIVRTYNISQDDFFSCNVPTESGEPCGECDDCKCLDYIYRAVDYHLAEDLFIDNNFKPSKDFYGAYISTPLSNTAKLYINNSCQMSCRHCLYGFKETKHPVLKKEGFIKVIDKLVENGVENIDFTGKEPLINKEEIMSYVDYIREKYPHVYITTITNGLYIKRYTFEELNKFDSISMSVEDTHFSYYRTNTGNILSSMRYVINSGVHLSVSIDLNTANCDNFGYILRDLNDIGVQTFYVKPIIPMGDENGENVKGLSPVQLIDSLNIFKNFESGNPNITKIFELKMQHINSLKDNVLFKKIMQYYKDTREPKYHDVTLDLELYCDLYSAYHITPDGYLLGCGFMLGSKEYDKLGLEDFLQIKDLDEAVVEARYKHVEVMKQNKLGCYFSKYTTKKGCLLE